MWDTESCVCAFVVHIMAGESFSALLVFVTLTSQALKDGDFIQVISLTGEIHFWKLDEQIT